MNPSSAPSAGLTGDALLELGRYGAAAAALQRMIDLRPDVSTYARVSYFREMRGDWPGAVEAMTLARDVASDPADLGWTGFRLGELYFAAGRTGPALREYRRAAELAPDHVLPPVGLAKVAAARGELDRATGILNRAVARYPYPEFVILLGDLYREAGQPAKAREQYRLVEAIDRLYRAGGVNTDLEMALFRADHRVAFPDSLARARAEYASRPSIVAADTLGWVLYASGRFREADRYAREALRFGTPNALFRFHAGMIAFRLGEKGVARRRLAEALSLNPNFSFRYRDLARRTLERLS